ncbi:MAG: toxin-antitoxin system HicB family antitoxin [Opitutales bacterium]|nr:toxin-antitoxin system HicB family antitoxin [Opitutales bacterium]
MSTLSLRLPDSLHRRIKDFSEKEGVSINQFISSAVAEKMSAISTEDYLRERASRGSAERLKEILGKVPDQAPIPEDEL